MRTRQASLASKLVLTLLATAPTAAAQSSAPLDGCDVVRVSAGSAHTLAVRGDGTLFAWGYNNYGQLGIDSADDHRDVPSQVLGRSGSAFLRGVQDVAAGEFHSVALLQDGTLLAWGWNEHGAVGMGTVSLSVARPTAVVTCDPVVPPRPLDRVIAIAAGSEHTLALDADGTVWSWGWNGEGELGDGTRMHRPCARAVTGLAGIVAIAGGYTHSAAVRRDGMVFTWGDNSSCQLGRPCGVGSVSLIPTEVPGFTRGVLVATGQSHTAIVRGDGSVWSFGGNDRGQLGNGTTSLVPTPIPVPARDPVDPARRLTGAVSIAAGLAHTAIARSDSSVWGWGANEAGQLGDGTTVDRPSPARALGEAGIGFAEGAHVTSHSSAHFTFTLDRRGILRGSGDDYWGQLGNGAPGSSTVLVRPLLSCIGCGASVVSTAAGRAHGLALRSDGTVWSWGFNALGQLGREGFGPYAGGYESPGAVVGVTDPRLEGIIAIAAGDSHSLALREDGKVFAWGWNSNGQLGDGSAGGFRARPVEVAGPVHPVIAIAAGVEHSMALDDSGAVWTWGRNHHGQLGVGRPVARETTPVLAMTGAAGIAAGGFHALVLGADRSVWAWGDNSVGQLGLDSFGGPSPLFGYDSPQRVRGEACLGFLAEGRRLAAGRWHSLVLLDDGRVVTFGANDHGQLGTDSSASASYCAAAVVASGGVPIADVRSIAAGDSHGLALRIGGRVWAWGWNVYGQLGEGGAVGVPAFERAAVLVRRPEDPTGDLRAAREIEGGFGHTLAVLEDRSLLAWGHDDTGQLGDGAIRHEPALASTSPVRVIGLAGLEGIAAGRWHSLAVDGAGLVTAWGLNDMGQLGTGSAPSTSTTPLPVVGLPPVAQVAAGWCHSIAISREGRLWAWGDNRAGALGDGTRDERRTPVRVRDEAMPPVARIAGGAQHTLALDERGQVWAWGLNLSGQLGGPGSVSLLPRLVAGLPPIVAIAAGADFSLAVSSVGEVWAWGDNDHCQLGDGLHCDSRSSTPARVKNLSGTGNLSPVTGIAAGDDHAVALLSSFVVAWGASTSDQLGDGVPRSHGSPLPVLVRDTASLPLGAAVAVGAGARHSFAIEGDGNAFAWGDDHRGQCGVLPWSMTVPLASPVSGLELVRQLTGGNDHSLALTSPCAGWGFGANESGQVGDGTNEDHDVPVPLCSGC